MSSPMIQDSCSIPDSTDKRGSLRSLKNLIQVQIQIQNLIFRITIPRGVSDFDF